MTQLIGFSTGHLMHQRIVVTAVIALALASCQKKASGQTVAVVNNEEITAGDLNAELANNANAGGDTKEARNAALQNLINRKLLVQQAKSDGIDKSPEYLNRLRRATDDLMINMLLSRRINTSQLPSPDQIRSYEAAHPQMFANREIWTLSQIIYPLPKDPAVTAKLSAAKTLDEVAQILTSSGIQFNRGTRKIDTSVFNNTVFAQVGHVAPGEPFIAPGPDKAVASVITERQPNPTPPEQASTIAVNLMRREQVEKLVQDRVKSLRATAKIEYQPGFGPASK
jgi:EpsD family peptidyl-prolyl cis-trans isomerase